MRLGVKSFVVLGLVAQLQEATAYDIKVAAQRGIELFWPLTHTGLYDECQRLASARFIAGSQEARGRRRTVYRLTDAGSDVLTGWLGEPMTELGRLRDPGLVKLHLGADPARLACPQVLRHQERLQDLEYILAAAAGRRHNTHGLLFSGLMRVESAWILFWKEVAQAERVDTEKSASGPTTSR